MGNDTTELPDFVPCGYNWTGPVMGESAPLSTHSEAFGYVACVIAAIFWGSNYVPLKFVKTGDGIFCQWIMCSAVFVTGLIMQLIREQPVFFPEVVAGGAVWTIGNCFTVPIINLIGLSIGLLLWCSLCIVTGWAFGRFGVFGNCPEVPSNEVYNYIGVALCLLACVPYAFVKTETKVTLPRCLRSVFKSRRNDETADVELEVRPPHSTPGDAKPGQQVSISAPEKQEEEDDDAYLPNWPPFARRLLAVGMAVTAGLCYGVYFIPYAYAKDHYVVNGVRASQNGLDYVFAEFTGIYVASTVIFVVYVAIKRKKAYIDISIILPTILCGVLWGIAGWCSFLANSILSLAITYPIIETSPGMIGALWGIFVFGEIRGLRNFLILGVAFALTIAGTVLTALSK